MTRNKREQIAAQNLRNLRKFLDVSRPAFAEMLQIPPTTIKNYELGYRTLSFACVQNIATLISKPIGERFVTPTLITKKEFVTLLNATQEAVAAS